MWPKELTREGKALTSADGEIYGDLFIAEGLAEFSKATGELSHWDTARDLVLKCVRLYDRDDYRPTIGQTYLGPNAPRFPGARIQGVWMVLIRVVTQMLEMHADAELERVARRSVDAITNHHYNPEFQLINELLNHDLSRPQNEYAQLVYTGHCIENLWMLMKEAERLRDDRLFEKLAALVPSSRGSCMGRRLWRRVSQSTECGQEHLDTRQGALGPGRSAHRLHDDHRTHRSNVGQGNVRSYVPVRAR